MTSSRKSQSPGCGDSIVAKLLEYSYMPLQTQAYRPRMESLKNFSSYVYMFQNGAQFLLPTWTPTEIYVNLSSDALVATLVNL